MGDIANAAMAGDIIRLALIVSLTLVGVLSTGVWVLMRERAHRRELYDNALEKRLGAGSEAMAKISARVEQMNNNIIDLAGRTVKETDCKECRAGADAKHDKLSDSVHAVNNDIAEIRLEMRSMSARMDSKLETMIGLLGKVLVLPASLIQPEKIEK